jgi:hypothetical protein
MSALFAVMLAGVCTAMLGLMLETVVQLARDAKKRPSR